MSFGVFQFRRGTAAAWAAANTVLADGELGIERDTAKFKIGDGVTAWNALAYGGIKGDTGASGSSVTVVTATTAVTAASGQVVLASGTFNVTLPAATANRQVTVKNTGTGVITVAAATLIDGAATAVLSRRYQSITVVADGTNWHII